MIALCIILGVILLISFTRIRVYISRSPEGAKAVLRIGLIRLKLYPRREKPPGKQKEKSTKEKKKFRFKMADIPSARKIAGKLFGKISRLVRFDLIALAVTSGGDDAAKIALNHGRMNVAAHTALPVAKKLFRIKKVRISLDLDYTLPKTTYYGKLRVSVSIGRTVAVGVYAFFTLLMFMRGREKGQVAEAVGSTT